MTPPHLGSLYAHTGKSLGPITKSHESVTRFGMPVVYDSGAWSAFTRGIVLDLEHHARLCIEQARPGPNVALG